MRDFEPESNGSIEAESAALRVALDELEKVAVEFSHRVAQIAKSSRGPRRVVVEAAEPTPESAAKLVETPAPTPAAPAGNEGPGVEDVNTEMEAEAKDYLAKAKRRADAMVRSMLDAVEAEAASMREEAERGIRARWAQVELEAGYALEEARREIADLVTQRRERIALLSDEIIELAERLVSELREADEARRQFRAFVEALSDTAEAIARGAEEPFQPSIREPVQNTEAVAA